MSDTDEKQNATDEKLDAILEYLKKQGAALTTIGRRLDTIDAEMKMISEAQRRIGKRQSSLEDHYAEQAGSCQGVMAKLHDRITGLEQQISPIPRAFDPDKTDGGEPG
jgi:DNA repair ATPase RecN